MGALVWSVLLIVAATTVPLYGGTPHSSGGASVEAGATIVAVNG